MSLPPTALVFLAFFLVFVSRTLFLKKTIDQFFNVVSVLHIFCYNQIFDYFGFFKGLGPIQVHSFVTAPCLIRLVVSLTNILFFVFGILSLICMAALLNNIGPMSFRKVI